MTGTEVRVERVWILRRAPMTHHWLYECVGPDGTRFDNRSIVELRRVLKRHYGKDLTIIETWKDS